MSCTECPSSTAFVLDAARKEWAWKLFVLIPAPFIADLIQFATVAGLADVDCFWEPRCVGNKVWYSSKSWRIGAVLLIISNTVLTGHRSSSSFWPKIVDLVWTSFGVFAWMRTFNIELSVFRIISLYCNLPISDLGPYIMVIHSNKMALFCSYSKDRLLVRDKVVFT